MSDIQQKVIEMARLTMLSNKLNDVQLYNLKMYPLVFFNDVSNARFEYDLSNQLDVESEEDTKKVDINYKYSTTSKHLYVSYYLTLDTEAQHHLPQRFEHIEKAVRTLFWPEVNVLVHFNDKLVYESKK